MLDFKRYSNNTRDILDNCRNNIIDETRRVVRRPERQWLMKGHDINECFVDPGRTCTYVNIPKNASTSVKNALGGRIGWQVHNINNIGSLAEKHHLVLLRDPATRWISGICEYLTMYHTDIISRIGDTRFTHGMNGLYGQELALSIIFDRFVFDDHTDNQTSFLNGYNVDQCHFIFIDKHLETNLNTFLNMYGFPEVTLEHENVANLNSDSNGDGEGRARSNLMKAQLHAVILHMLENSIILKERLLEYLWEDISFMQSIQFANQQVASEALYKYG
jgi:hypothetical protein